MEGDDESKSEKDTNEQSKDTSSSKTKHGALPEIKDYKQSEEFKD